MDDEIERKILKLLDQHRIMTLLRKYPEQASFSLPMSTPADVSIFRVTPTVISVLDYSKGFGHTDLVTC